MKKTKHGEIPYLTMHYAEKYKKAKLKSVCFDYYTDPYMVFSNFFGADDIVGHLLELKKIYRSAARLKCAKISASNAIYSRELFSVILNAAWVIDQTGLRFSQITAKEHYLGMNGGELKGIKIERHLTDVEFKVPYLGVKNVFKKRKLANCHSALYEWLKLALCKNEYEQDYKGRRGLYKSIVKIIICVWLIYEKEILLSVNDANQPENN